MSFRERLLSIPTTLLPCRRFLFMLLALPRGAKAAAKVALKFALSSHASFAAAATGAAAAGLQPLTGPRGPAGERRNSRELPPAQP